MKKILLIQLFVIMCMFTRIDSFYAAGSCGIDQLDTNTDGRGNRYYGYTYLDGSGLMSRYKESNYGLTTGSGQWAVEFSYGTVWGMANCNNTSGTPGTAGTPTLASSGQHCWCQATGFTASGNSYTSGPQCTTSASALWVLDSDLGDAGGCADLCVVDCSSAVRSSASFRGAVFGAVPNVQTVDLTWYDGNSTITGPSSCTVGGTFLPPTPPARPGYVFTGWKIKPSCAQQIQNLDTSKNGDEYGYQNDSTGDWGADDEGTSEYGITTDNTWAAEFDYGTVWGKSWCSTTSGDHHDSAWDAPSSDWLKTPSDTAGGYCWCQATGFATFNEDYDYTSGPSCTTSASSSWVFKYGYNNADTCAWYCAEDCASSSAYGWHSEYFRAALFNAVGQ